MQHIRIGTRGSRLALWQAEHIAALLKEGGFATEIVKIETKGDKILDVSIAKIGSKGVFTEEIETQLAEGSIDIAVHSAKDMPSVLPEGFELIAFTEREKAHDVLVSHREDFRLDADSPPLIGTASTRRVALLKRYYPKTTTTAVRGNLQTRIAKMKDGACDALLLAYAGVHRMGYTDMIKEQLPFSRFIPAVGQGSIAIECYDQMDPQLKNRLKELLNHSATEQCLLAERAFLKKLQGGCSIPVFAMAVHSADDEGQVTIKGGIISLNGKQLIEAEFHAPVADAHRLGEQLADHILKVGGDVILREIRAAQQK